MNKARRHELKMLKFRKRIKEQGFDLEKDGNLYAYRSHGKPCSCGLCRDEKFRKKRNKKQK